MRSVRAFMGLLMTAMFVTSCVLPIAQALGPGPRVLNTKDGLVWIDEKRITNNPSPDIYPQISIDTSGNSHVLWIRDNEYIYLRLDSVGRIGAQERNIATASPPTLHSNQLSKAVGIDDTSNISFIQSGSSSGPILYNRYTTKSAQVSGPTDVTPSLSFPQAPNLVVLDNGSAYVTYKYYPGGNEVVGLSILDPQGQLIKSGGNITYGDYYVDDSTLIVDRNGDLRVVFNVWHGPSVLGMYVMSLDKDGKALPGTLRYIYGSAVGTPSMPAMAACPDGSLHILRSSSNTGGGILSHIKLDGMNRPIAGIEDELDITQTASDSGDLACNSQNNLYIIWADSNDGQLYYENIEKGTDNKTHIPIMLTSEATAGWPKLAIDADDNLHVVWQDARGGDAELYYRFSCIFGAELTMAPDQIVKFMFMHPQQVSSANLSIKNRGGLIDNFTLDIAIDYNGFEKEGWSASLDFDRIEVGAQEANKFFIYVVGPTTCTPNEHIEVIVNATSERNPTKNASITFSAYVVCTKGIEMFVPDSVHVTGAGQTTEFQANLKNTGDMREDLLLNLSGPADWTYSVNMPEIVVQPRESKTFTLSVTPPSEALANEVGVIMVQAQNVSDPEVTASAVTHTMVMPMMALGMTLDDPIHYVDPGNSTDFDIKVTNDGNLPGTVIILIEILSGVGDWSAYLSSTSVGLKAMESAHVKLTTVSPPTALAGSRLVIRLYAYNEWRTQTKEITATTIVNRVNMLAIVTAPPTASVDPGGTAVYQIRITNLGNIGEVLGTGTALVPPGWFLSYGSTGNPMTSVMVVPGATANLSMEVQVPLEAQVGSYHVQGRLSDEQGNKWMVSVMTGVNQQFALDLTVAQSIRNGIPGSAAVFDCGVRNFGNGPDLVSLRTESLPTGWVSQFVLKDTAVNNFTLGALKGVRVSLVVSLPAKVSGPTMALSVVALSSSGFREEVALVINVGLPNIRMVNVTYSSSEFKVNKAVSITVLMRNTGEADCQNVSVSFYQDGQEMGTSMVKVFPAGTERFVTFNWAPKTAGDRSMSYVIDPQNQLGEGDKKDNSMSQTVRVKSGGTSVPGFEGVFVALGVIFVVIVAQRRGGLRGENL